MNVDSDIYRAAIVVAMLGLGYAFLMCVVSAMTIWMLGRSKTGIERRELISLACVCAVVALLGLGAYASFSLVSQNNYNPVVFYFAPLFIALAETVRYSTTVVVNQHSKGTK